MLADDAAVTITAGHAARVILDSGSRAARQVATSPPIPPSNTSTETKARSLVSATAPRNKAVAGSPVAREERGRTSAHRPDPDAGGRRRGERAGRRDRTREREGGP